MLCCKQSEVDRVARRGRYRSPVAASAEIIRIKLRLYPGQDDDLIRFFDSIPFRLRAAMVKTALRSGGTIADQPSHEDDDVLDALDALVS